MEKVGFRKVSEIFLEGFCSAILTVDHSHFLPFYFFIVVTYKPLAWFQIMFSGGKKQYQITFKLHCMFISKLFYNLIDSLRSKAKLRISHRKSNVVTFTTHTELGLPVAFVNFTFKWKQNFWTNRDRRIFQLQQENQLNYLRLHCFTAKMLKLWVREFLRNWPRTTSHFTILLVEGRIL